MDPTTLQGQAVVGGVPQMAMQPQGQRNWTQLILESIQRQHNPQGWRKAVTPQERTVNVMKLWTSLALVQDSARANPEQVIRAATDFEKREFENSPDKARYEFQLAHKLGQIRDAREQKHAAEVQAAHQQQAQQGVFQQGAMQAMLPPQGQQTQQGQPFNSRLQRPMQASAIPTQQRQPPQAQQQFQQPPPGPFDRMAAQAQPQGQQQHFHPNMQRQQPQRQPGPDAFTQQENEEINNLAQRLANATSQADMQRITAAVPPEQRAHLERQGTSVCAWFFRQHAVKQFRASKARAMQPQQPLHPDPTGAGQLQPPPPPPPPGPVSNASVQGQHLTGVDPFFSGPPQMQPTMAVTSDASQPVMANNLAPGRAQEPALNVAGQQGHPQLGRMSQAGAPVSVPNPNAAAQLHQQRLNARQTQAKRLQEAIQLKATGNGRAQAGPRMAAPQAQAPGQVPQMGQVAHAHGSSMPIVNQTPAQGGHQPQPSPQNLDRPLGQQTPQQRQQQFEGMQAGNLVANQMPPGMPDSFRQQAARLTDEQRRHLLAQLQQHQQAQRAAALRQAGAASIPATPQTNPAPSQFPNQPGQQHVLGKDQFPGVVANQNVGQTQRRPDQMRMGIVQDASKPQTQAMAPARQPHMPYRVQQPPQQGNPPRAQQPQVGMQPMDPRRMQEMDSVLFPRNILNTNTNMPPDHVRSWGQLKEWVARNQHHMPPGSLEKLTNLQGLHIHQLSQARLAQRQSLDPSMAPPTTQGGSQAPPGPIDAPGPRIPVAQMGRVGQPPRPGPVAVPQHLSHMAQVSQEAIDNARASYPDKTKSLTDDQVREGVWQARMRQAMQMQNNGQGQAQGANSVQPQNDGAPQLDQNAYMQRARQAFQQRQQQMNGAGKPLDQGQPQAQPSQQKPSESQGQPPAASNARNQTAAKPSRPGPQGKGAAEAQGPTPSAPKGVKRASEEDEAVEAPGPRQTGDPAGLQRTQSQQRPQAPVNNAPQVISMLPNAQVQDQARARAQTAGVGSSNRQPQNDPSRGPGGANVTQPEQIRREPSNGNRLNEMLQEVIASGATNRSEIDMSGMDDKAKEMMSAKLRTLRESTHQMEVWLPPFFRWTGDEAFTKELIRIKFLVRAQTNPARKSFIITPTELDQFIETVKRSRSILSQYSKQNQIAANSGRSNPAAQQRPAPQPPTSQPAPNGQTLPLNASNLLQQEQQQRVVYQMEREKSMQRLQSGNQQSAAPGPADRAQFPLGAPSPHGVPVYLNNDQTPDLTPDKLRIPPPKRRKNNPQGSNASTPNQAQNSAGATASPQVNRSAVPESKAQRAINRPEMALPHTCPIIDCEFHNKGFASLEELAKHQADAHEANEPPIDDPLQFTLDAMADALGLNRDGTSKRPKESGSSEAQKAAASVEGRKSGSAPLKVAQTSALKREVSATSARPASRLSQQATKSASPVTSAGKTPQALAVKKSSSGLSHSKSATGKDDGNKKGEQQQRPQSQPVQQLPTPPSLWNESSISPEDLRLCFEGLDSLGGIESFHNMQVLTPQDTPSSSKADAGGGSAPSGSSRNSDISENDHLHIKITKEAAESSNLDWNPFGLLDDDLLSSEIAGMSVDGGAGAGADHDEKDAFEMEWDNLGRFDASELRGTFAEFGFDAAAFGAC